MLWRVQRRASCEQLLPADCALEFVWKCSFDRDGHDIFHGSTPMILSPHQQSVLWDSHRHALLLCERGKPLLSLASGQSQVTPRGSKGGYFEESKGSPGSHIAGIKPSGLISQYSVFKSRSFQEFVGRGIVNPRDINGCTWCGHYRRKQHLHTCLGRSSGEEFVPRSMVRRCSDPRVLRRHQQII
jgi:hypothetical protein